MRSNHRRESYRSGTTVGVGRGVLRFSGFVLMVLTMACGLSGRLHAKVAAGVSGIVTDSSGAVVAGATVQMKATETGIVETRQTNGDGFYAFVNLQPGLYEMEVTQTGFTAFHQVGIVLDVDSAK